MVSFEEQFPSLFNVLPTDNPKLWSVPVEDVIKHCLDKQVVKEKLMFLAELRGGYRNEIDNRKKFYLKELGI